MGPPSRCVFTLVIYASLTATLYKDIDWVTIGIRSIMSRLCLPHVVRPVTVYVLIYYVTSEGYSDTKKTRSFNFIVGDHGSDNSAMDLKFPPCTRW